MLLRPLPLRIAKPRLFLSISTGDGQTGTAASLVPTDPKVRVLNQAGGPVAGVSVSFADQADGSVNGSGSAVVVATDASGYASVQWGLRPLAGSNTMIATLVSTGATVTFTATGVADVAFRMVALSATDQSGTASSAVGAPPSIFVVDSHDNPVSGQAVTWAVASGGGSINTTGATSTDASGIATLTSWTLGGSAGANSVTATIAGLVGSPVTFVASAAAGTPHHINLISGGPQSGVVAGQAATATVFRVLDSGGNPIQGITVSFSADFGTVSVPSAVSDASGNVSVILTTAATIHTATLTASVNGGAITQSTTIASTYGTAAQLVIRTQASPSGTSGQALSQQPIIEIQDANGNLVANSTLTVTVTIASGNALVASGGSKAAVAGVATFTALTLTDSDGGSNTPRYSSGALTVADGTGITLAPPTPTKLGVSIQPPGAAAGSFFTLAIDVQDASGFKVPGATNVVAIALTTPGGATVSGAVSVGASNGTATFSVAVDLTGSYTFTCTSGSLTSVVTASFTISAAGPGNEPAGMSAWLAGNLATESLNTAFTNASSHQGALWYDYTQGRVLVESMAAQSSWRNAAVTAFPLPPNGKDLVVVNELTPDGSGNLSAGNKGMMEKTAPGGTKGIYLKMVCLMSANWRGEPHFKRWYFKTGSDNPMLLMCNASGAGPVQVGIHYQGSPGGPTSTFYNWTRNTWLTIEVVAFCAQTPGGSDAHCTVYLNGSFAHQRRDAVTASTSWTTQQWLAYMGGQSVTSGGAAGVPQYFLTTDDWVFKTTTSWQAPV